MRHFLLGLLILSGTAPALAQTGTVDRRVDRLEKELRAVQRKVFPNGPAAMVEPEITEQQSIPSGSGVPASSAVADLTARVDSLEAQLRTLTGQTEENAHRLRQLEESLTRLRAETEGRLGAVEATGRPDQTSAATDAPGGEPSMQDDPIPTEPGEAAYVAGYRQWSAAKYAEAQKTLEAMIKKYPKHARISHARNLLGRAYLDGGKPATAAKVFLANYQGDAKGERAADSLYFLGQALVQLKKPAEACEVYEELEEVYGGGMRDWVKQRLPKARKDAKCG